MDSNELVNLYDEEKKEYFSFRVSKKEAALMVNGKCILFIVQYLLLFFFT